MATCVKIYFLLLLSSNVCTRTNANKNVIFTDHLIFWPNATVPFYINPNHFDQEQSLAILKSISVFTFKTCLHFKPVFAAPNPKAHVMVFENPLGVRKCVIDREGHSKEDSHRITVGFECMKSPQIDMLIMKSLGFPFEHNRASRDIFIDVQFENIEPGAVALFTKERILPVELRNLPYDANSVMHFGNRDFSKNGHRTFFFKNSEMQQHRIGLSSTDLQKIQIIYGSECKKRDRQEKIELCKSYPTKTRKKRSIDVENLQNLRINRDITPPADNNRTNNLDKTLKELGFETELQEVVEKIHKLTGIALKKFRTKNCNLSHDDLRSSDEIFVHNESIIHVIDVITDYVKSNIEIAATNVTALCDNNWKELQRYNLNPWQPRSTKIGKIWRSTQYRPTVFQPTRHEGRGKKSYYESIVRVGNITENNNLSSIKRLSSGDDTEISTISNSTVETPSNRRAHDLRNSQRREREGNIQGRHYASHERERSSWQKSSEHKQSRHERAKDRYQKRYNEYDRFREQRKERISDRYRGNKEYESRENRYKKLKNTSKGRINDRYRDNKEYASRENRYKKIKDRSGEKEYRPSKYNQEKKSNYESQSREFNRDRKKVKNRPRESKESPYRDERLDKKRDRSREMDLDDRDHDRYRPQNRPKKQNRDQRPRHGDSDEYKKKKESNSVESSEKHGDKSDNPHRPEKSDMGYKDKPEIVELSKKSRNFYEERKWPDGIVPYIVQEYSNYDTQDVRARLGAVKTILQRKTCVKLVEITEEDVSKYHDYLVLDTSADYVTGKVGGKQNFGVLELFKGGQHIQHAAMMVMAMLGFYFEVARPDRDDYIRVHTRHIRPDKLHHFEIISKDAMFPLPYDYNSATHPAWQFWRRIGKTGISSVATYKDKDPNGVVMKMLGQNKQLLSKLDIIKINTVYGTRCFKSSIRRTI